MTLLEGIGALALTPVMFALVVFTVEIFAGLVRTPVLALPGIMPSTAVLMPAHNEANVIEAAVSAARMALNKGDRLLVVADNCSDETARLAREAGAEVIERHDPNNRGKGFALAFGMQALSLNPPDSVIVLDADCWPAPNALARLSGLAVATGRPVQACYLLEPGDQHAPVTRVSNFAFLIKNLVRQRGLATLGGTCILTGSGMAFPFAQLAKLNLANGEIVEDLVLGLRLVLASQPPMFDAAALVYSQGAPSDAETGGQRRRWEHGFIAAAVRFVPPLLWSFCKRPQRAKLSVAFHLIVPPFALLLALSLVTISACGLLVWFGLLPRGFLLAPVALTALAVLAVVLAWRREGRHHLSVRDLLTLPRYIAAKGRIWASLVTNRQSTWNRTGR